MKKLLLFIAAVTITASLQAQVVNETVSIGSGYANQVWYSLDMGETGSDPKDNWDLAFQIAGISSAIRVNGLNNHTVWTYPNGDTSQWNNIDTSGHGAWNIVYDSDSSWGMGAFNRPADLSDPFDLGWGTYNLSTHHVTGDRIFIMRTGAGVYKKIWILKLAGGTYSFRIANLDGTNEIDRTIDKTNYNGKVFAYYDIDGDQNLDREPIGSEWDLLFTQYPAVIPGFGAYPSTGVLLAAGVTASRIHPVNDPVTYNDTTTAYQPYINTIGYQWKSYNFGTNGWDIADSTVYLVKLPNRDIWKMVMTGFGGQATGDYEFSKEKIYDHSSTVGIGEYGNASYFLQLYPNPSIDGEVTVAFDLQGSSARATLRLTNLQGQTVWQDSPAVVSGLQTRRYSLHDLPGGIYFLTLETESGFQTQRLVIQ
ncbi:MAG: T9SS type A sorting domain-containing protein [Salibacteraceae bacterium]